MPSKCPHCEHGQTFQEDLPNHIPCGECAGTGWNEVAEAAREIDAHFWPHKYQRGSGRKRRETIARFVASAVLARERTCRMG